MTDYKQKLQVLIAGSALESERKLLWELFIKASLPDEAEAVYEAVSEEEGNLELLTRYLADKIWEIKERDQSAWQKLAAQEKGAAQALELVYSQKND